MVAHTGLIVLAVVVVAAGAAALENPQVREWLENSRRKIALALHSLGDEINPRVKHPRRNDPSMEEDETEAAEERRRRARAEIMEKGRIMEEKRRSKRKSKSKDDRSSTGSFDTLVDRDGMLKNAGATDKSHATTTAVEAEPAATNRRPANPVRALHESVDAAISLRQLSSPTAAHPEDALMTEYEREMRNTWNLPLPHPSPPASSTHASESLLEFTPTSEFPDPDIIVPGSSNNSNSHDRNPNHRLEQTDYFSLASSHSSHTLSETAPNTLFHHAHDHHPHPISAPSISSIADSSSSSSDHVHVHASDAEAGEGEGSISDTDGVWSEYGDGIRTPASGWTDVGSVVSGDGGQ